MLRRVTVLHVVSGAVMAAGLFAAILLCLKIVTGERAELQRTTEVEARHIAAQLENNAAATIERLERLANWWLSQGKPLDREDWSEDGQLFLTSSPGLRRAIWVARDGYQYWSAAPGAQPTVLKKRPDSDVAQIVSAAHMRHTRAMSGLFSASGVPAFYFCSPVRRGPVTLGYVVGLYDGRTLVKDLAQHVVRPEDRITVTVGGREVFASRPAAATGTEEIAEAGFRFGERDWTVAVRVPLNYFHEFRGLIAAVIGVIGALIYSFGTLMYLAQRRSAELQSANAEVRTLNQELQRKVADFQTLLDVTPIGIAVADDPECHNIRANPALAKMLGVPVGANISKSGSEAGKWPWRLVRDGRELRPEELPMQIAAATRSDVFGEEDQIIRADGSAIDILSFASPVFDERGAVRGVLNACIDITERKHAERLRNELQEGIRRSERMKSLGAMAAGIAHDFNNLLTGIIGQASLAAESLGDAEPAASHITASLEAAQQAARLIRKVLAYTGQSYLMIRPIDLGEAIRGLQPQLEALAGEKAAVRIEIAPDLPQVMADIDEVGQVLRNIVLNAVEATGPEDGGIDIRVDAYELSAAERVLALTGEEFAPGSYVQVEVKDKGHGMPYEIAEKAFDPFFSTKFLGRGLGLSEVLGIMRAHHGAVRLDTAPDSGTSVKLFFPAKSQGATDAKTRAA